MDKVKSAKPPNARATIKLSEIDFMPVYIALVIVLISIGKRQKL